MIAFVPSGYFFNQFWTMLDLVLQFSYLLVFVLQYLSPSPTGTRALSCLCVHNAEILKAWRKAGMLKQTRILWA